ncbi:alkaline phosphatase [Schizophyllum commune H4-8]|uniref:alkaline phosphatase n=1 Tax=Schizophyllum commune (strain H4-8 / FGSC 9210) TaxID=578458 RepID=D8Q412_SCHCM|nr:alkaline phosphatase [Schizophyllum commune H4-8]KAI5892802.1 alkaline phosphatase [Schizophyllum commune H4-8]
MFLVRGFFVASALFASARAQYYKRLGGCPTLGCLFPPDQSDFLPGQLFDIRVEVHAPVNGSEAFNGGVPDEGFVLCIQEPDGECVPVEEYFGKEAPALEKWDFSYYEDLFAEDADNLTGVNVASKAWRAVSLPKPGDYIAKLKYYDGIETVANWTVRAPSTERKAKNVLLFIGDGMTQSMITAARLIGHKSINGRYQSLMQMDQMDALGHQMTHSLDSFITDSANSATALYTGRKSSVNALNVYADSSATPFDDPKHETIAEMFRRETNGGLGIVSTAVIGDATPAALCAHTRDRDQLAAVVYEYLYSPEELNSTLAWPTSCKSPDVIFGGGAELFLAEEDAFEGRDMYGEFGARGYNVVFNKTALASAPNDTKTLGIFSTSNMAKWLDRQVYPDNLKDKANSPTGDGSDATDQPGLKDMTLKAIDILNAQYKEEGWFMMSEAASIDKMMHVLDYDRALGELLELDDTIRATLAHLKAIGEDENTLVVVTADHGHGFDVFGGADTMYISAQEDDRSKRRGVGIYANSGLSGYQVATESLPNNDTVVYGDQGPNFPVQWAPRYAYAAGFAANPDHREDYSVNTTGPRLPAVAISEDDEDMIVNEYDNPDGFVVNGTLPTAYDQGVHSLTDVSVFASGPGSEAFRGVYNNIDIFFKIAGALALGSSEVDQAS